jgi:CRP-like cAMP-binding protein
MDATSWKEPTMGLTNLEKALRLQRVDVLRRASTEDLCHIAQIATELELPEAASIYREGEAPDALYVVIDGKVRLFRGEIEVAVLGEGEAFGTWALIDESPRVASAAAVEPTVLLKVAREDFQEILAERVDIVQAIFKAMVERLRDLANVAHNPS